MTLCISTQAGAAGRPGCSLVSELRFGGSIRKPGSFLSGRRWAHITVLITYPGLCFEKQGI